MKTRNLEDREMRIARKAEKHIEQLQNQWHDASKELPEGNNIDVIVCINARTVKFAWWEINKFWDGTGIDWSHLEITHWMYKPAPPDFSK